MNELIKELMIESGSTGTYQVWFTRNEVHKLAELIVRECIGIDYRHKIGLSSDDDYEVSRVIKQHFGIE